MKFSVSPMIQKSFASASLLARFFEQVYRVEQKIKEQTVAEKLNARQEGSAPLMQKVREWLDCQQETCLPKSLLGKAVSYANKQWDKIHKVKSSLISSSSISE